jgi:hypothetical protein
LNILHKFLHNDPMNEDRPRARKRGIGCLPGLALIALASVVGFILIELAFQPWIFVVGGRVRIWPVWEGDGVVQTPIGPYRIHVWFSPTPSGSRILPSTSVRGSGYVCTPLGEKYSLRVTGGAPGRIWKDMDGHAFRLSAYHRPISWFNNDRRPRLSFSGQWVGPNLVMSDDGSIAHAFLPNGTLSADTSTWHPKTGALPITLTETSSWFGGADCAKLLR